MNQKKPFNILCMVFCCVNLLTIVNATPNEGFWGACKISPLEAFIYNEKGHDGDSIEVFSNEGDTGPNESHLKGDVTILRDRQKFTSDSLYHDRTKNILSGSDQIIRYATPNSVLEGNAIKYFIDEDRTLIHKASYFLKSANSDAQGVSAQIDHRQASNQTEMEESTYSTCPVGNEVWALKAKNLIIDHDKGLGVARDARFTFFDTPILYTPYFSFPIDDERHSGLLFPHITLSKGSGLAIRVPYYWNIAPNFDMTLMAGIFTNRGILFGAETRYLNEWQNFVLNGEYLPSDSEYRNRDRWSFFFDQQLFFSEYLSGKVLFQKVSDDRYIKDLNDAIGLLSQTNLERHAELNYSQPNWSATIRLQHFQIIDREAIPVEPYARLPQAIFTGTWHAGRFAFGVDAEAVRFNTSFDQNKPERARIGDRLDVSPFIRYRLENAWGFIEPALRFRYTNYHVRYSKPQFNTTYNADGSYDIDNFNQDIEDYQNQLGKHNRKDTSFDRALPIISLDSGIFLERDTEFKKLFGGGEITQTLEPRLFYLYIPYRPQSHIPIFDTSEMSPSYRSLFRTNIFNGADRQANANQLTLAMTSRFIRSKTGKEMFKFSTGVIRYFDTPRITLGNDKTFHDERDNYNNVIRYADKDRFSEIFLDGESEIITNVYAKAIWLWSPELHKSTRTAIDLRYQPDPRKVINLGYRYQRNHNNTKNNTDQIDFTSFWELNPNWAVVGRYNYSIQSHRMVDSYLGFEYNDCCVSTRIVARYHRDHPTDKDKRWKAYLQFELKGLGNFGQDSQGLWKDSITGYNPP